MVRLHRNQNQNVSLRKNRRYSRTSGIFFVFVIILVIVLVTICRYFFLLGRVVSGSSNNKSSGEKKFGTKKSKLNEKINENNNKKIRYPSEIMVDGSPILQTDEDEQEEKYINDEEEIDSACPIVKISDLSMDEQYPKEDSVRHIVTPPKGGKIHLVCCTTTVGPLSIAVHEKWAPNGAERFLDMVQHKYFQSHVPLFRCIKGFICQFGLNNDPKYTSIYTKRIQDDKQWLPAGPDYRQNPRTKVKRFAMGYLAYAGAGPNSRSNQFIVALGSNGPLGGGSPWEVPWGELVGDYSYETLSKIYTGYGEKGPTQGVLYKKGVTDEVREEFPDLDYITGCTIVDEVVQSMEGAEDDGSLNSKNDDKDDEHEDDEDDEEAIRRGTTKSK